MKIQKKLVSLITMGLLASLILTACADSPTSTTLPTTVATTNVAALPSPPTVANTVPPTPTELPVPATITVGPTPLPSPLTASWVKNGVCYEVFVRSFFDSNGDGKGDLQGLTAKLDYFNDGNPNSNQDLGINCLWLMPITASPSYHGYDTTDYYTINPEYGTNNDFKQLMSEAHKRGIRILMDLVINHTSDQHPWFKAARADPKSPYRDWYIFTPGDPSYRGPWGDQAWHRNPATNDYFYGVFGSDLPDLNFRNPAVTKQIYDYTRFWLKDMDVDGFRIDAVKHLVENGRNQQNTPETRAWLRDFRKFYTSIKPDAFTIGEINGTAIELTGYYPDQLDSYFEFDLARNILSGANSSNSLFALTAEEDLKYWPFQRFGTFLTNHDQDRVMSVLAGDQAKMRLASAALLTLPGLPFLYYGEEIGMKGIKPDPQIRTPMQWTTDGGFTTGQAWKSLNADLATINVQTQAADPNSLLNHYRKLISLRQTQTALAGGNLVALDSDYKVATYIRQDSDQTILVILNMTTNDINDLNLSIDKSSLVAGTYKAAQLYNFGNKAENNTEQLVIEANGKISGYKPIASLPARSGYILLMKK